MLIDVKENKQLSKLHELEFLEVYQSFDLLAAQCKIKCSWV